MGVPGKIFSRCVFTDGLKVVGGLAFISPSTPLQQHGGPKNDTVFKKSSYYITEACTPQKTTSNFVFLKTFSTI